MSHASQPFRIKQQATESGQKQPENEYIIYLSPCAFAEFSAACEAASKPTSSLIQLMHPTLAR